MFLNPYNFLVSLASCSKKESTVYLCYEKNYLILFVLTCPPDDFIWFFLCLVSWEVSNCSLFSLSLKLVIFIDIFHISFQLSFFQAEESLFI